MLNFLKKVKILLCFATAFVTALAFFGCAGKGVEEYILNNSPLVILEDEGVPLAGAESKAKEGIKNEAEALPASAAIAATSVASGELTKENDQAIIDYSNTAQGYVMVKYTAQTTKRLKAQVKGPKTTYTYNLEAGKWAAFPLADENGSYKITVFKNASGTKYATVLSLTVNVELDNEFAPFLHSNQYVDFDSAPKTVEKAAELCKDLNDFEKIEAVYSFTVNTLSYDTKLAKSVKSGYLPVLDDVLKKESGICFDYAALMTGMLRSQGIPCKLVVGYAGEAYHAWISVWTEKDGWIDGVIFFDGDSWQRMDPTFASSGNSSKAILKYIGNGKNYTAKYIY